jgi:hypothetical protein
MTCEIEPQAEGRIRKKNRPALFEETDFVTRYLQTRCYPAKNITSGFFS